MYKVVSHYYEDVDKMQGFRDQSNKLWTDHFMYTRDAIIGILNNTTDVPSISLRLSKNQEDIGALISPYYSADIVKQYVDLLKQHMTIAGQYVDAAKAGNPTVDIEKAWAANGEAIVNWKSSVNPWNWPRSKTEPLWTEHMKTTLDEIKARIAKDWVGDIAAADNAYTVIRSIAKGFADGIIYQNIEDFSKTH